MGVSDWVLIFTALFLGAIALFVPYLAEITKRKYFAPNLKVQFESKPPDCHKTWYRDNESVYYFRFRVTNTGKSQAKRCEVVIEKLYKGDAAGNYHQIEYSPTNLVWGSSYGEYVDINPKRTFYCDLFLIPCMNKQLERKSENIDVNPKDTSPFDLGFILSVKTIFFSQPNRFPPGEYKIMVAVFSENSPKITQTFKVIWSGKWEDTEDAMLKEAVLCLI